MGIEGRGTLDVQGSIHAIIQIAYLLYIQTIDINRTTLEGTAVHYSINATTEDSCACLISNPKQVFFIKRLNQPNLHLHIFFNWKLWKNGLFIKTYRVV